MFRPLAIIFAAGVTLFGATAAHAGTHWSIGINLPVPGVVIANGGYYASEPQPVYYEPAPVVHYAPLPVYDAQPVYAAPRVIYSNEQPVYEVPFREELDRTGDGLRDRHWEQHREFERARWEHSRHDREEQHWDRGEHRRDQGDSGRWHHD